MGQLRFQNQSLHNLRKGYEEFDKKYIKDLSINYTGQLITENNCNYYNFSNNADVSNNYTFNNGANMLMLVKPVSPLNWIHMIQL